MFAGIQGAEIGNAVDAQDHGFAVDHEALLPVPHRGLGDPREALGPVIAAAGDQPDTSPTRSTRRRYPSYFTSWNHSALVGTALPTVGMQNSNLGMVLR